MRTIPRATRRRRDADAGFALMEIMVVVLVLAVLIAVAIPMFLRAKVGARDRAARVSLQASLTSAKAIFTDAGSYAGATTAGLGKAEPALKFQGAASTGPKVVRVHTSTAKDVMLSAQSASVKCYFVTDSATYGSAFAVESGTCAAAAAPGVLTAKPKAGTTAAASASGKAPTWAASW